VIRADNQNHDDSASASGAGCSSGPGAGAGAGPHRDARRQRGANRYDSWVRVCTCRRRKEYPCATQESVADRRRRIVSNAVGVTPSVLSPALHEGRATGLRHVACPDAEHEVRTSGCSRATRSQTTSVAPTCRARRRPRHARGRTPARFGLHTISYIAPSAAANRVREVNLGRTPKCGPIAAPRRSRCSPAHRHQVDPTPTRGRARVEVAEVMSESSPRRAINSANKCAGTRCRGRRRTRRLDKKQQEAWNVPSGVESPRNADRPP